MDMVVIVGHRGAAGLCPENTIASFERAIAIGVDAIEFDVRKTADDALVVLHDATVNRTTDGCGATASLSLETILSLDAGAGTCILPLERALEYLAPTSVELHIDLKETGIGPRVLDALERVGCTERTILFSSLPDAITELPETDVTLGISVDELSEATLDHAASLGVSYVLGPGRPDQIGVERARDRGFLPGLSTINERRTLAQALNCEPYSVLTDRPDRAIAIHAD